jgi:uncharacterized LabA/DUF88 family protein
MTTKVIILIDGGFYWQRFLYASKKEPQISDVLDTAEDIMKKMASKTNGDTKDILFRIFYYDCPPFEGKIKSQDGKKDIDCSKSPIYLSKSKFLNDLCKEDKFALRRGELSFAGWKQDLHNPKKWKPDFNQKGVDMKVGLDMATIAMKRVAEKIVLVAGDSDFIAPVKFVRKEGLQVYLYRMGNNVKNALIEHCDFDLK